jgi:predicted outer membrane repeat protein
VPSEQPTIQAGIAAASPGDTVEVAPGTYRGEGNRDIDLMGKPVVVRSAMGPEATAIDCEELGQGFKVVNGEVNDTIIEGFAVVNGNGDFGGGIVIFSSSPVVLNCVFSLNTGNLGGAALCTNSAVGTFENCVFEQNSARMTGGAVCISNSSSAVVVDCTFVGNQADPNGLGTGGGVAVESKSAVLRGCVFDGNTAGRNGGGLYVGSQATFVTVENTVFHNNFSELSSAMSTAGGTLLVQNTIIAFHSGYSAVGCASGTEVTLTCCDVYDNAGGNWVACLEGQGGINGNFSADPRFCDPTAGDFTLAGNSPCLPGNHPQGIDCGLIGALEQGCPPVAVESTSWGRIKAQFRKGPPV